MMTYATIAKHSPTSSCIRATRSMPTAPMKDEVELPDGSKWMNVVLIDAKRKVAETLAEYRDQWKYNMMDEHVRALNASCPTFFQWDDHEVINNWSPSKDLLDRRPLHREVGRAARRPAPAAPSTR